MSIYVSITRRPEPLADDGPMISSDEWLAAVDQQEDFRLLQGHETAWVGDFARVWSGHSEYPVVFDWVDGQIDVKNPDEATVVRMKKLAGGLSAIVISETGEILNVRESAADDETQAA